MAVSKLYIMTLDIRALVLHVWYDQIGTCTFEYASYSVIYKTFSLVLGKEFVKIDLGVFSKLLAWKPHQEIVQFVTCLN